MPQRSAPPSQIELIRRYSRVLRHDSAPVVRGPRIDARIRRARSASPLSTSGTPPTARTSAPALDSGRSGR